MKRSRQISFAVPSTYERPKKKRKKTTGSLKIKLKVNTKIMVPPKQTSKKKKVIVKINPRPLAIPTASKEREKVRKSKKRHQYDVDDDYVPMPESVFPLSDIVMPPVSTLKKKKPSQPSVHQILRTFNVGMKKCYNLLKRIQVQPYAYLFNSPVDIIAWECPDYFTRIKRPMDFGTIKSRMERKYYAGMMEYVADMRQVFYNCFTYNDPDNWVYIECRRIRNKFESEWKKLLTNELLNQPPYIIPGSIRKPGKKKRPIPQHLRLTLSDRLNRKDKRMLLTKIQELNEVQLSTVVEIYRVGENIPTSVYQKTDLTLHLNKISERTLKIMIYYVNTYIKRSHVPYRYAKK